MNHTLLVSPVIRAFAEARDASNLDPDPTKQWRNFNPERKRVAIANTMSQWLSANTGNAFIEASVADFGRRALKPLDDADAAAAAAPQTGAEAAMAQWRASRVPSTPFFSNVKDAFERKAADQYANVMDREDLRAQLNHDYEEQKLHGAPPEGGFVSELVGGLAATLGGIGLASVAGSPVAGLAYAGAAEGIAARTMGTRNAYYAGLDRGDDEDTAWATAKNVGLRSGVIMGGVSAVPIAPAIGALGKGTAVTSLIGGVALPKTMAGTLLPGAANMAEKAAATSLGQAVDKAGAKLAGGAANALGTFMGGSARSGGTRFAEDTLKLGALNAVENVAAEGVNIGQERLIGGVDTSAYSGDPLTRLGMAAATGASISTALKVGNKVRTGAQARAEGRSVWDTENEAGQVGAVFQLHRLQKAGDIEGARKLVTEMFGPKLEEAEALQAAAQLTAVVEAVTLGTPAVPTDVTTVRRTTKQPNPKSTPENPLPDIDVDALASVTAEKITFYRQLLSANNTVKLGTILHENAHLYLDSLSPKMQALLFDRFHAEMSEGSGPFFTRDGTKITPTRGFEPRMFELWDAATNKESASRTPDERAADMNTSFREWFSERMMVENLAWAEGRVGAAKERAEKTGFGRMMQDIRLRTEMVGRAMGAGNALNDNFRSVVDSGPSSLPSTRPSNPTGDLVRGKLGLGPYVEPAAKVEPPFPTGERLAVRPEASMETQPTAESGIWRDGPPKNTYEESGLAPGKLLGEAPPGASAAEKLQFTTPAEFEAILRGETADSGKRVEVDPQRMREIQQENLRESLREQRARDPLAEKLPTKYQEPVEPSGPQPVSAERQLLARDLRNELAGKPRAVPEPGPAPRLAVTDNLPEAREAAPAVSDSLGMPDSDIATRVPDPKYAPKPAPADLTGERLKRNPSDPAYNYGTDIEAPLVRVGDTVTFSQKVETVTARGATKLRNGPRTEGEVVGFTEGGQITLRVREAGRADPFEVNVNSAKTLRKVFVAPEPPAPVAGPKAGDVAVAEAAARGSSTYEQRVAMLEALRADVAEQTAKLRGKSEDYTLRRDVGVVDVTSRESGGRVFVSPNIQENVSFADAVARLNGPRQGELLAFGKKVDAWLPSKERVSVLGEWLDGVENSTVSVYGPNASYADLRVAGALLGDFARQKAVIVFRPNPFRANSELYDFVLPMNVKDAQAALTRQNIINRTLAPSDTGTRVFLFDDSRSVAEGAARLAYEHNIRIQRLRGQGEFLGDWESREVGAAKYRQTIADAQALRGADAGGDRGAVRRPDARGDAGDNVRPVDETSSLTRLSDEAVVGAKSDYTLRKLRVGADHPWRTQNGWLLPDGSFRPTEASAAILDVGELGAHARDGLGWLESQPKLARQFWKEQAAKYPNHDPREDGPPPMADSDVYAFLNKQGWARITDGGSVTYADGRLTAAQSRALKDNAIESGKPVQVQREVPKLSRVGDPGDYVPSSSLRDAMGQEDGYLSQREDRAFPARAGKTDAELDAINVRRPDILTYEPQTIADGVAKAKTKTDAELDLSVATLKAKVESDTLNNFLVTDSLELMQRSLAKGDTAGAEVVYDSLSKAGTTLGQLLRQMAEFRTPKTPDNILALVEMSLAKKRLKLQDTQRVTLAAQLADAATARDVYDAAVKDARDNPATATDKVFSAVDKLEQAADRAERIWRNTVNELAPRDSASRDILAVIQGNLLTPKSTLRNFWHNYATGTVRLTSRQIGSMTDAVQSALTGTPRELSGVSLREAKWAGQATVESLSTAKDILLRGGGNSSGETIVGERIRGFHPVDALMRAFNGDLPVDMTTGKVPIKLRAGKLAEAFFGMAPEPMLRSLAAMDEVAKAGFRASRMAQETYTQNLQPGTAEYVTARLRASVEMRAKAEDTAKTGTFQQDSAASQAASAVEGIVRKVGGEPGVLAFRLLTSPYIKTPVNVAVETVAYVVPTVAAAQVVYYARNGNRREANLAVGKFATGLVLSAVTDWLLTDGLISGGPDSNPNVQRFRKSTDMETYRLNTDGLKRKLAGGDGTFQNGDTTIRLDMLGIPGVVMGVRADMARMQAKGSPNRVPSETSGMLNMELFSELLGMSRFMVDTTMLQSVGNTLHAMATGDPVRVAQNVATMGSVVRPDWANTVTSFRQAQHGVVPDVSDKDIPTMLRNIVAWKQGEWADLPKKLDLWGNPIKPAPEGADPYLHVLGNIAQPKSGQNPATTVLQNAYAATGDDRVIPGWPSRNLEYRDLPKGLYLPAKLYQSYVHDVQQAKLANLDALMGNAEFLAAPANVQVRALDRAYDRAAQRAGLRWRGEHREELEVERAKLKDHLAAQSPPK